MNTLNNQQINPGNRVDFSRIRKYENPSGRLTARRARYSDWNQFLDSPNVFKDVLPGNWFHGETVDGYYIRHNNRLYRLPNYNLTSEAMMDAEWVNPEPLETLISNNELVKHLGIIRTTNGKYIWPSEKDSNIYIEIGTDGTVKYGKRENGEYESDEGVSTKVFDPQQGWVEPVQMPQESPTNLKGITGTSTDQPTDQPTNITSTTAGDAPSNLELPLQGKVVPLTPKSLNDPIKVPPIKVPLQGKVVPLTPKSLNDPIIKDNTYTAILPQIKPYKPAPIGNSHLGQIYATNINSINEREKYALNIKTPKQLPLTYHSYTTSGYLQLQLLKLQLADERTKYLNSAMSNDIDKSMAAALKFELEVVPQYNNAITNSIDQHILNSKIAAKNDAEKTLNSLTATANYNNGQDALQTQLDANTKEKYATLRAAETASYLLNLAESESTYNTNENNNWKLYNTAVNHYIYTTELNKLKQLYREAMSWDNTVGLAVGKHADGRNVDIESLKNAVNSALTVDANNTKMKDISDAIARKDIVALREALEEVDETFLEGKAFLAALQSYNPGAEEQYLKGKEYLDSMYNYIQTYSNRSYSNAILGGQGLDYNLSTVYPDYVQTKKKGGKLNLEDRLLKYLEHNRKVKEENNRNLRHSSILAEKRLLRDLDALDRETLLLLRSIFK